MIERKIKPKLKIVFSLSPRAHHVNEGKHTYIDIESSAAVAATYKYNNKTLHPENLSV